MASAIRNRAATTIQIKQTRPSSKPAKSSLKEYNRVRMWVLLTMWIMLTLGLAIVLMARMAEFDASDHELRKPFERSGKRTHPKTLNRVSLNASARDFLD